MAIAVHSRLSTDEFTHQVRDTVRAAAILAVVVALSFMASAFDVLLLKPQR